MTKAEFEEWQEEGQAAPEGEQPIYYPNLNEALIGWVERFGMEPVPLYDREKVIEILMRDLGCDEEGAEEWYGFNTLGTWAGSGTPAFATLVEKEVADGRPVEVPLRLVRQDAEVAPGADGGPRDAGGPGRGN